MDKGNATVALDREVSECKVKDILGQKLLTLLKKDPATKVASWVNKQLKKLEKEVISGKCLES